MPSRTDWASTSWSTTSSRSAAESTVDAATRWGMLMSTHPPGTVALDEPAPPPGPVSFEEFVAWALRTERPAEWVDGEIIVMSPESLMHDLIAGFLYRLLADFI